MISTAFGNRKFEEVDQAPLDTPSEVCFSEKHDLLATSCWDSSLYFYSTQTPTILRSKIDNSEPLLTTTFLDDKSISGDTVGNILIVDLHTGTKTAFKLHENGIRHIRRYNENLFITGSWDKTIKITDMRSGQSVLQLNLPERVFTMDLHPEYISFTIANNQLKKYDIKTQEQTSLTHKMSYHIKSLAVVDHTGLVIGGIDGKCEYVNFHYADKKYTFRTHRTLSDVYATNAIQTHPINKDYIVTGGGDGNINFFNKATRQKIHSESFNKVPVTCLAFNKTGSLLAVGLGNDWSTGFDKENPIPTLKIFKMSSISEKI